MTRWLAAVLCMAAVPALAAPGLAQEPLPADAVARVGADPIPKTEFDHWFRIAARGEGGVVEPPPYTRCVASERRRARKAKRRPTQRALRGRCERRYKSAVRETVSFLVQARWVRQEAAALEIVVTPERVRRAFERQKREAFGSERAYRRFVRETGFSEVDLLFRTELDLLQQRLTAAVTTSIRPVTTEDVKRYYAKHRRGYRGKPRRKALTIIRTLLTARRQMRALGRFIRDFRPRYRSMTVCAAGYVVDECGSTASAPQALRPSYSKPLKR